MCYRESRLGCWLPNLFSAIASTHPEMHEITKINGLIQRGGGSSRSTSLFPYPVLLKWSSSSRHERSLADINQACSHAFSGFFYDERLLVLIGCSLLPRI